MGMLERTAVPNLPAATEEYDKGRMEQLLRVLRIFFSGLNAVQSLSLSGILFDKDRLPTEADVATLRAGTVYRDSTDGNILKVKI